MTPSRRGVALMALRPKATAMHRLLLVMLLKYKMNWLGLHQKKIGVLRQHPGAFRG
jgi:hypothetical protein